MSEARSRLDSGATLADQMRTHAAEHQHLYGVLMRSMAADWDAGGPVRRICSGWESAPSGSAIELRLLAGLFRLVMTGRAPALVGYYACLGGREPAADVWPVARRVLHDHVAELHDALGVAPQTNEVARSGALLIGLFDAVRRTGLRRVRLLEPGASAGLNLLVDRFRFVNETWSFGPASSTVVLADTVAGDVEPLPFAIVDRRGCDLSPVDPTTPAGRLRLRSFVWPFHVERHVRLSAALEIAARHPVPVDVASAGEWLEARLSADIPDDVVTVVWQSITRQYWPAGESARVREALAAAARRRPVVHVSMEYPRGNGPEPAELVVSGTGAGGGRRLGSVGDHGVPVTVD